MKKDTIIQNSCPRLSSPRSQISPNVNKEKVTMNLGNLLKSLKGTKFGANSGENTPNNATDQLIQAIQASKGPSFPQRMISEVSRQSLQP